MEIYEEAVLAPVSPIGQYLSTSVLSLSVIAVLELEIPLDDSQSMSLVKDVFLPINPRFSSVMVANEKGEKQWKKVEVNIEDHMTYPIFPATNSTKFYDESLNEYISKMALEKLQENKPLWEIHIIKYPTKEATESLIFKLHHSLGDGFSLKQSRPSLTINDVISGAIFLGARLYMEEMSKGSGKARATSLVLLNTRMFRGYKSVEEMVKPDSEFPWGNNFTMLLVPIPKLNGPNPKDPLDFVWKAQKVIQRKRSSFSLLLLGKYLQMIHRFRGAKAVSKFMHGTLKNTSMGISNLMGPLEKMALTNHPISGLYFYVAGPPQSLKTGIVSYMNKLRVAIAVEKDFVDPHKLKLCVENSFHMIFNAAVGTASPPTCTCSSAS